MIVATELFKFERDIGIIAATGVFAGIVIISFAFVILQATGKVPLKNDVLISVVNGQTPSIGQFGVGMASMDTFCSVFITKFVLKLNVALALEVETNCLPDKTLTCVSVESEIPSQIKDISDGKDIPQPNVFERLTGKQ